MNTKTTIIAVIFSFLVFILAFLYFHIVEKPPEHIPSLINKLVALANSVFVALIAGNIKIKNESISLLEREPKAVAIGTAIVFASSLMF